MQKSTPAILLKKLILEKEAECESLRYELKEHIEMTQESLKPVNLLKGTLGAIASSPGFKASVLNAGVSFIMGFVIKKIFRTKSTHPIAKLLAIFN
jgi:hypothetical protein